MPHGVTVSLGGEHAAEHAAEYTIEQTLHSTAQHNESHEKECGCDGMIIELILSRISKACASKPIVWLCIHHFKDLTSTTWLG